MLGTGGELEGREGRAEGEVGMEEEGVAQNLNTRSRRGEEKRGCSLSP